MLTAHLHPIAVPSLTLDLLLFFVLLAVASTIFAMACPSRIKEFSYERWVDEFRRPGISISRWDGDIRGREQSAAFVIPLERLVQPWCCSGNYSAQQSTSPSTALCLGY